MYEIFEMLLKRNGVKVADVCRATGLKPPTFSDWKKGKSSPNVDKLILIANYFGVTVEYLRTGNEKEYTEKVADEDTKLIFLPKEIKEYAIKLSELSVEDRKDIMKMIDRLGK